MFRFTHPVLMLGVSNRHFSTAIVACSRTMPTMLVDDRLSGVELDAGYIGPVKELYLDATRRPVST